MATLQINCPECEKEIKAPEEAIGKKIRCKACEHVFVVAKPKGKASPAKPAKSAKPPAKEASKPAKEASKPAKSDDDDEEGKYGLQEFDESYRCPDCANPMEDEEATVCLHCGFNTKTRSKPRRRKVKEVTAGDRILWLLPGVAAAFSIPTMIGYCALHHFVFPSAMFDEWDKNMAETNSRFETIDKMSGYLCMEYLFHPAIELWLVIMTLFFCFLAAKFAIRRLFINYTPPEIEVK